MKGGLPHFVCMACYNENYTIDENYTQDALDHKQNKVLLKKQQNDKPCVHDKSRAHHAEEEGRAGKILGKFHFDGDGARAPLLHLHCLKGLGLGLRA